MADKCNRLQGEIICGFLADCATMLRQQQAEIELLKQIIDANNLNQNIGQFVNEGTPDSELAEHKRIIREQQAELDAFKLNYYNTGYSLQLRDKDETIKQQQAEIEQLRKIVEDTIGQAFYEDDYHKAKAEIEALKKQIPDWKNINKPNPFIGLSENSNHKPLPPNSGLGGSALKKASKK